MKDQTINRFYSSFRSKKMVEAAKLLNSPDVEVCNGKIIVDWNTTVAVKYGLF